jgi:hypothetical protein
MFGLLSCYGAENKARTRTVERAKVLEASHRMNEWTRGEKKKEKIAKYKS